MKKALIWIVASLAGLLLLILVVLQAVLTPSVLTGAVNKYAPQFVEGDVHFDNIRAHVIRSFPYLSLEADDFSLTYPHERYARYDSLLTGSARMLRAGYGRKSATDTLLSLRRLEVQLNYMSLLKGKLNLHRAVLEKPRIFAHYFDSTAASWDILPLGGDKEEEEDTTSSGGMGIELHRVSLTHRPFIVYTNPQDTLHLLLTTKDISMDGELNLSDVFRADTRLSIDSLFVSGRLPADTVALGLSRLDASMHRRNLLLDAHARAHLLTGSYGRMRIPIHIGADVDFPRCPDGETVMDINSLVLALSSLELKGAGNVRLHDGLADMDVKASVEDCPVGDLMKEFTPNFPVLGAIAADALVSLNASASGTYGGGQVPLVNADVPRLYLNTTGVRLNAKGAAEDLLGGDPLLQLDGKARASLDTLSAAFLEGIQASGKLRAEVKLKSRLSALSVENIAKTALSCSVHGDGIDVLMPSDSIKAYISSADIGFNGKRLTVGIDTLSASRKDSLFVRGKGVKLRVDNPASPEGELSVEGLRLKDLDGIALFLRDNSEKFSYTRSKGGNRIRLSSRSGAVGVRTQEDAVRLTDLAFSAKASERKPRGDFRQRRKHILDSLQRVYPGVPRDSLLAYSRNLRLRQSMQDDFESADVSLSLSKSIRDLVRKWNFGGDVSFEKAGLRLASLPLKTTVTDLRGNFTDNVLNLENITVQSGSSDLTANASVTGIRRLLLGRRKPQIDINAAVTSEFIDAGELLAALGSRSGETEEAAASAPEVQDTTSSSVLALPSNVNLNFSLESTGIKYDSLLVAWAAADIVMKQRTLQISNCVAASNMGDVYLEGFYATRSKKDMKAGFDLKIVDITAEKVMELFPGIATEIPLLGSFAGKLNCEMSATSDIDTTMSIITPTVNGVMRLSGDNMSFKSSSEFNKIAKVLMFKDREKAVIDNLYVSAIIRDNVLDVFPFVLTVDRYTLAASGAQELDRFMNYHVSVIRSPLLVKFGINIWGQDLDHLKYGIGKARYPNPNVPVFTKQLNSLQYNLVAAIHNVFELGVEQAISENNTGGLSYSADALTEGEPQASSEEQVREQIDSIGTRVEEVKARAEARRSSLRSSILEEL